MKHNVVHIMLTALLATVAVFDLAEGILVLMGICAPPVKYQGTLFPDATIPMLLMVVVVGGSALLAAATVFIRQVWSVFLAAAAGLLMLAWEVTELVVVHQSSTLQSIFMYAGLLVIALAGYLWTTELGGKPLKHTVIRMTLLVLEAFIGVSAIQGGLALLQGALDQWVQAAWLVGTPWSSYTIPGLVLVIVVGGSALFAAATVFIDREWIVLVSALAGLLMAGYEMVEAVSIDSKVGDALLPTTLELQLAFFVPGLLIFGLAGFLWMRDYGNQRFHPGHISHA